MLAVVAVSMVGPSRGNRFQEAWVMNCEHTFSDGTTYDLSPLTRTAGRPDYMGRDKANNNYYMNICSNVQEIPKECRALNKNVRSPVYQVDPTPNALYAASLPGPQFLPAPPAGSRWRIFPWPQPARRAGARAGRTFPEPKGGGGDKCGGQDTEE